MSNHAGCVTTASKGAVLICWSFKHGSLLLLFGVFFHFPFFSPHAAHSFRCNPPPTLTFQDATSQCTSGATGSARTSCQREIGFASGASTRTPVKQLPSSTHSMCSFPTPSCHVFFEVLNIPPLPLPSPHPPAPALSYCTERRAGCARPCYPFPCLRCDC